MSKPPAKRRAKRKAADADIDYADDDTLAGGNSLHASLDLSNPKTGPKAIASALLALLPEDATKQHAHAQKLVKAFPMVVSELDARSNILARATQAEGDCKPISFRFPAEGKQSDEGGEEEVWTTISLPEDSFLPMLKFLTGKQIVNNASLVSKAWLAASRSPLLWETLDKRSGLTNSNKKLNMTALRQLLGRPQFAGLKHLAMPQNALKLSEKSIKQISKLCPHLQLFDIGYATDGVTGPKAKDGDLLAIAENFPNLNAIHTHMWSITANGIVAVAKHMGPNLLDLRIRGDTITETYLSDYALGRIAESCPNLQYFAYKLSRTYYKGELDRLSGNGILSLVSSCRRLVVLELENSPRVERETIENILRMLALAKESNNVAKAAPADVDTFALRKVILLGYPFVVTGNPLRLEDTTASNDPLVARLRSRIEEADSSNPLFARLRARIDEDDNSGNAMLARLSNILNR